MTSKEVIYDAPSRGYHELITNDALSCLLHLSILNHFIHLYFILYFIFIGIFLIYYLLCLPFALVCVKLDDHVVQHVLRIAYFISINNDNNF